MYIRLISPIPFDATALACRAPHAEWPDCPHVGMVMTEVHEGTCDAGLEARNAATAPGHTRPAGVDGPWTPALQHPGPGRQGW